MLRSLTHSCTAFQRCAHGRELTHPSPPITRPPAHPMYRLVLPPPQVFERYAQFMDAELQQRAVEYRGLAARPPVAAAALQPLPKWDKRTSLLLRRLAEKEVRGEGGGSEGLGQGCWCSCVARPKQLLVAVEQGPLGGVQLVCMDGPLSALLAVWGCRPACAPIPGVTRVPAPHPLGPAGRGGGRAAGAAGMAAGAAGDRGGGGGGGVHCWAHAHRSWGGGVGAGVGARDCQVGGCQRACWPAGPAG